MKHSRAPSTNHLAWLAACASLWLAAGWSGDVSAAPADLHAGRITPDTPEVLRIRGSDAIAGLGDWYLSNGTICAAILGVEHHGQLVPGGGNLVDLGHCGRDDDQWIALEAMYNLSRDEMFRISEIDVHVDVDSAEIVTRANDGGLELVTRYRVDHAEPARLDVFTRITRESDGHRFFSITDILVHTVSALRNFIANDGGRYSGFRHTSRTKSSYLTIASAIRTAQGIVLVGSEDQGPPISYLYRVASSLATTPGGRPADLASHALGFSSITLSHFGTQPSWFSGETPSVLGALGLLVSDLPIGDSVELHRELWLSKRADVASLTDRLYKDPTNKNASVDYNGVAPDPETRVHVFRAGSGPTSHITMARPDARGRLSFHLPRGKYRFEFLAPGGRKLVREADLTGELAGMGFLHLSFDENARIALPTGSPMRLAFRGEGDTPDPTFGDDLTRLSLGDELKQNSHSSSDVHLSGEALDPTHIELAPGKYRVYATRGPEYSLSKTEIEVAGGDVTTLDIEPPSRLFETTGWISADFHVHSAASFDSTLAPAARLRSFAAEGAEVLIATEHDAVSDYSSLIDEFGLEDRLTGLTGLELTTISPTPRNPYTTGHLNLFPFPYRPDLNRGGAIQDEGLRLREIIAQARALPDAPIVQINHPRETDHTLEHEAFLDHLSVAGAPFDPDVPLDAEANRSLIEPDPQTGRRDIDFDAIELMNGKKIEDYRVVLRDWFSLLAQGRRISGMANSDSHNLSTVVAVPRNYVRFVDTGAEEFDDSGFYAAVRKGHLYGTSGPLLDVSLEGAGPGDRFRGSKGKLNVGIRAAPWVPVSTLRIYSNGRIVAERTIGDATLEAHRQTIEMNFDRDSFVVVEVEGPATGDYAEVLPGFTPHAFTNPIFIDADGDGSWTPPGLPLH